MRVAVYGTLKEGHGNHRRCMASAQLIACGTTQTKFSMHCVGFPVVTKGGPGAKPVAVEVYEVNKQTRQRLDQLEDNGRMYQRERRWIKLDDDTRLRAWLYVGISPRFKPEWMRKVVPTDGLNVWPDNA